MIDSITVGAKIQMTENITGDYPVNIDFMAYSCYGNFSTSIRFDKN